MKVENIKEEVKTIELGDLVAINGEEGKEDKNNHRIIIKIGYKYALMSPKTYETTTYYHGYYSMEEMIEEYDIILIAKKRDYMKMYTS